jgi:hypothetical protein
MARLTRREPCSNDIWQEIGLLNGQKLHAPALGRDGGAQQFARSRRSSVTERFARSARHLFFFLFETWPPWIAQPSNGGWGRYQLMQQSQAFWL